MAGGRLSPLLRQGFFGIGRERRLGRLPEGAVELPKVLHTDGAEKNLPQGGIQDLVIERERPERHCVEPRVLRLGQSCPVTVGCFLLGLFAGVGLSLPAVVLLGRTASLLFPSARASRTARGSKPLGTA